MSGGARQQQVAILGGRRGGLPSPPRQDSSALSSRLPAVQTFPAASAASWAGGPVNRTRPDSSTTTVEQMAVTSST